MVACLRASGIRGGYADYWVSYKLTFLSDEQLIIAPATGVNRYTPYSQFVAALDETADILGQEPTGESGPGKCLCGTLRPVIVNRR